MSSAIQHQHVLLNDGRLYNFTTSQVALRKVKIDSSLPTIVYGQVLFPGGKKSEGEIISLTVSNESAASLSLAALTDANGYWLINTNFLSQDR